MNKNEFITILHDLNACVRTAIADSDFDEVRRIDERRQEMLHELVAEGALEGDDELFTCLESFSSEIAENIKDVEKQFGGLSRRASHRFKMLDGYRV